ncbi:UPF0149 family protein [Pseudomonadota bacterium]
MSDFEMIERQLGAAKVDLSPAEVQGLLCGLLCHTKGDARGKWINELLDEGLPSASLTKLQTVLDKIYSQTIEAMNDQEFGFQPLLPHDKCSVTERSQALSTWCQGFLYGFGLSTNKVEKGLSDLSQEALKDLTEITRMDTDLVEESDENEAAFIELEEFLRVVVMTIYDDLAALREAH